MILKKRQGRGSYFRGITANEKIAPWFWNILTGNLNGINLVWVRDRGLALSGDLTGRITEDLANSLTTLRAARSPLKFWCGRVRWTAQRRWREERQGGDCFFDQPEIPGRNPANICPRSFRTLPLGGMAGGHREKSHVYEVTQTKQETQKNE